MAILNKVIAAGLTKVGSLSVGSGSSNNNAAPAASSAK